MSIKLATDNKAPKPIIRKLRDAVGELDRLVIREPENLSAMRVEICEIAKCLRDLEP